MKKIHKTQQVKWKKNKKKKKFNDFTYRNICGMDLKISAVQSVSCSIRLSNLKEK